jgi:hypothetical protein
MNLRDSSAVKHDWEFARTGSSRFDNEPRVAFVETGVRRRVEFCTFPTENAKAGRSPPGLSGCRRMLCAIRNQSHPGEVEDADSVPASAWASPLERVTQDVSRGIKEDAHTASAGDGKGRTRGSEGLEWQIAACRVFSISSTRFRSGAADRHFGEMGQGVFVL